MVTLAIAVSSVYPIDLTAGLYAGLHNEQCTFRLFLNDAAELPKSSYSRRFVARAALPDCQWEMDRTGTWRQVFIPIDGKSVVESRVALTDLGDNIADYLDSGGASNTALNVRTRSRFLAQSIGDNWAASTAGLIEEIYHQVLGTKIKMQMYGPYRTGSLRSSEALQAVARIGTMMRELDCDKAVTVRGGYIELDTDYIQNGWASYSHFRSVGKRLILEGRPGFWPTISIPLEDLSLKFPHKVRFGGPLEIALIQEFGRLAHLPWYSSADYREGTDDKYTGVEYISPISSASNERVSKAMGGTGYRLNPTGYSLIESDSPATLAFLKGILKDYRLTGEKLSDWRRLMFDFPRADQKISKYQGSVSGYCTKLEQQFLIELRSGCPDNFIILNKEQEEPCAVERGQALVSGIALLRYVKECCLQHNSPALSEATMSFLMDAGIIREGKFCIEEVFTRIHELFHKTGMWLVEMGFPRRKWEDLLRAFEMSRPFLCSETSISNRFLSSNPSSKAINALMESARELVRSYYRFAAFISSTVFKANILFCWLILGPDGIRHMIIDTLAKRGEGKLLTYKPLLLLPE
jgi:hypothetical protein